METPEERRSNDAETGQDDPDSALSEQPVGTDITGPDLGEDPVRSPQNAERENESDKDGEE